MTEWIALIAVIASPAAALAGVWLGNRLQKSSELQRWRLDRRADSYDELRIQAHNFSLAATDCIENWNERNRDAAKESLAALDRATTRVELVAPDIIRRHCTAVLACAIDDVYPLTGMKKIPEKDRDRVMQLFTDRVRGFFDAARADLRASAK